MEQETKANKPKEEETKAKFPKNHAIYKKFRLEKTNSRDKEGNVILERIGKAKKECLLRNTDAEELNSHKYNTLIEYVKK